MITVVAKGRCTADESLSCTSAFAATEPTMLLVQGIMFASQFQQPAICTEAQPSAVQLKHLPLECWYLDCCCFDVPLLQADGNVWLGETHLVSDAGTLYRTWLACHHGTNVEIRTNLACVQYL